VLAAVAYFASTGTAAAQFTLEGTYATGDTPRSVYAADFNADGRPDVLSSNQDVNTVSLFLRGAGGFAPEAGSPFAAPGATSNGTVADLNGDGRPDLAIADFNFGNGQVVILLRQAGGGFAQQPSIQIGSGNPASAVAAGDFNRDGAVDLAIAGWSSSNVSVYFNTATGFALQNNYAVGTNPRELAVADFNADGALDIAVLNNGSDNVTTLLGSPTGAFAQEGAPTAVGDNPFGITAGDLDGDGRPDLAVSNANDDSVSILLRSSLAGFSSAGTVGVGDQPINVRSADFDGNGTAEVAVTVSGGSLDVIRRAGAGFVRDSSTPLPGQPYGVAVADFNADGRPDVAVTSITANQLNVLLSPPPAVPPPPQPTPTATPTLDNPQVNREVNVLPVSGTVRVKRRGSSRFVDLKAGEQIPNGSTVDARKGRVTIVAAQSATKLERADFYDGLFRISQSRRVTTLTLTEQLACSRKARAAQKKAKKPKSRRLWGDGKGKFRTKGRYAAATVRGTRWLTRDTCTATKITVRQGSVSVRDTVRKRTAIVRRGKSYTARARR
jgi:hypothetical protein